MLPDYSIAPDLHPRSRGHVRTQNGGEGAAERAKRAKATTRPSLRSTAHEGGVQVCLSETIGEVGGFCPEEGRRQVRDW